VVYVGDNAEISNKFCHRNKNKKKNKINKKTIFLFLFLLFFLFYLTYFYSFGQILSRNTKHATHNKKTKK